MLQAESEAEKKQRRAKNEAMRRVLDEQISSHREQAAKPNGRMSDYERRANAALLRQVEEKLQLQFSNHSQLFNVTSTADAGHQLPPRLSQRR